jgi:hypothetical protein
LFFFFLSFVPLCYFALLCTHALLCFIMFP